MIPYCITVTLQNLTTSGLIYASRVERGGARVVVSLRANYLNDDPNIGYDAETETRSRNINDALEECGLRFYDAGCEEGGEYWIFVAA